MAINVNLLAEICEASGAPGYEIEIRKLILSKLDGLADVISTDNMGNVIALVKGKSSEKRIAAATHMDEIGFMVTHIDDDGFLRFTTLGGFDPKTLTAQRVIINGKKDIPGVMGCKPVHVMTAEERNAPLKISQYYIDTGLSKEEVEKYVQVGTPITRKQDLVELGDNVSVKSLDNRATCYQLLETLREIKESANMPPYDFYAIFTVQEEVGVRGAQVSALEIKPDFAIGLDVTIASDVPGTPAEDKVTSLGKGAAIKVMDASTICDYRMVEFMKLTADKHKIEWQPEILQAGGTDTASLQRMVPGGSIAGAISVPTRYIHQSIETASKKDIAASVKLLTAAVLEIDQHDWSL